MDAVAMGSGEREGLAGIGGVCEEGAGAVDVAEGGDDGGAEGHASEGEEGVLGRGQQVGDPQALLLHPGGGAQGGVEGHRGAGGGQQPLLEAPLQPEGRHVREFLVGQRRLRRARRIQTARR